MSEPKVYKVHAEKRVRLETELHVQAPSGTQARTMAMTIVLDRPNDFQWREYWPLGKPTEHDISVVVDEEDAIEPKMTADGYPTEETLRTIREWDVQTGADWWSLAEYVRKAWKYPDYWQQEGRALSLRTGGWSGNEDLIGALQDNLAWWAMCWQSSRRGGHYELTLPKCQESNAEKEKVT